MRFFLSKRTCLSVTIRPSPSPGPPGRSSLLPTLAQTSAARVSPAILVVADRRK